MSKPRARGFTLIELLTVIAIIAILVGITAAVLPGVMERSRIVKTETSFKELNTALAMYQTDNGSLPPGYGYYRGYDENKTTHIYQYTPYMASLKRFREFNLYDEFWATNYDFNANGTIDALEFQPLGTKAGNNYTFSSTLYDGSNFAPEVARMLNNSEQPPYAYFPVNRAQADKLRAFCLADPGNVDRTYARPSGDLSNFFANMTFPPAYYDDYVLISPGPSGNTFGVVPSSAEMLADPNLADNHDDVYYINALRTFYLATRDQNDNGRPDFDFRARTRGGDTDYLLPDGSNGAGPLIYHSGS